MKAPPPAIFGSSPLARGTCRDQRRGELECRLIPARAGNIPAWAQSMSGPSGSSPLARGTPRPARCGPLPGRLIPARAGNMLSPLPPVPALAAHPRSRGEHWRTSIFRLGDGGSSPLARGTSRCPILRRWPPRLIPARAGNIRHQYPRRPAPTAHPRSRGEHHRVVRYLEPRRGSSPLARGT